MMHQNYFSLISGQLTLAMLLVTVGVTETFGQLDERWTVTINGQTVQVEPDGSFLISNVSAPDAFGPGGPGTGPDFFSDDVLRGLYPVSYQETNPRGEVLRTATVGYLGDYAHHLHGVKILFETIRIRVVTNQVQGLLIKLSSEKGPGKVPAAVAYLPAKEAFTGVARNLRAYKIHKEDHIAVLYAELVYWTGTGMQDPVTMGKVRRADLMYRFLCLFENCNGKSCRKGRRWVYVDAISGHYGTYNPIDIQ